LKEKVGVRSFEVEMMWMAVMMNAKEKLVKWIIGD
jgi:hypothetical protein